MQRYLSAFILALASLAAASLPTGLPTGVSTTTVFSKCVTRMARKPVATIKTTTKARTRTITVTTKSTFTPVTTVIPPVSTLSLTITTTETAPTLTVISTSTSTIPPPAGFTPIQSYITSIGRVPAKRGIALPGPATRATEGTIVRFKDGKLEYTPASYPKAVICFERVVVVLTRTKIVTAATRTVTGVASTTVAITTNTITTTPTTTSIVSTTVEGACQPDNILNTVDGNGIIVAGTLAAGGTIANANSAQDCCLTCLNDDLCGGTTFIGNTCFLWQANTCAPEVFAGYFGTGAGQSPAFQISNGPCGQMQFRV